VSATPSPLERPQRADARRNRERILDAARVVFGARGHEAQMDDVAAAAGVGVGTVYRHFPDKESLMAELVRQKFALFGERARAALDVEGEPFEVLAELLRSNLELTAHDAATQHALVSAGECVWERTVTEREQLLELVGVLIDRAKRAGTMRADVSVADIPMLMCGVSATMGQGLPGFDWRRHFELMLGALRA
jgi:AcrR family transcriptional regulator